MDDRKVQEAASLFATIGFDVDRLEELSFSQFDSFTQGVLDIVLAFQARITMRTSLAIARCGQDPTLPDVLEAVRLALGEKFVLETLTKYRPQDADAG